MAATMLYLLVRAVTWASQLHVNSPDETQDFMSSEFKTFFLPFMDAATGIFFANCFLTLYFVTVDSSLEIMTYVATSEDSEKMLKTQYIMQWFQFIFFWPLLVTHWSDAEKTRMRQFVYVSLLLIMVIIPAIGVIHWLACLNITLNDPENSIKAWCAVYPLMCIMFAIQYVVIHPDILNMKATFQKEID